MPDQVQSRSEPRGALVSIGQRIRSHRRLRRMSQVELAELVGRTNRWLVKVESGQGDVLWSDLVKLSEALGTTLSKLVEERESNLH